MRDRFRVLNDDSFDAIVVGAGLGGLTAAAILAHEGRKVLVLDQHYVAGGNATIFRRRGYEFDVGVHYIGECGEHGTFTRILRAAGVSDIEFEELDPDGYDTLVFPDFTFKVPRGIDLFRDRLCAQFPAEQRGIDRYIAFLRQLDIARMMPSNPLSALLTLPRITSVMRWSNKTFGELLDSCTTDIRLKAVLAAQNGDYGLPPSRASALIGTGIALHYLKGAYYPKGGGQVIADRLADAIERRGGTVLLRSQVKRIIARDGVVEGVEFFNRHLGRRVARAPIVISNADLKRTLNELVGREHLSTATTESAEKYEMAPGAAIVYLGMKRDLVAEDHPRTNYWIFPGYDYEAGYAAIARSEFPDPVPFAFVSIASLKDPTNAHLAPPGITNVEVMGMAPSTPEAWGVSCEEFRSGDYSRNEAYAMKKRRFADAMLTMAERVFPDIRSQIAYQEVATPLTHTRFTGSTGGTSYGIAATPAQFMRSRPGAKTEIKGLYLCGASMRSGHGIVGVAASGMTAASDIMGRKLI